ncbi:multicopper oxidase family protein [Solirubrobacter soli]|uniref:multicopper oxidase family protein n=1 Tax=Solirubrobacter soli TaxID=363832 RepID=UPI000418F34B|nr:multicopper oxidase family protein [Solirubrobacter soli]
MNPARRISRRRFLGAAAGAAVGLAAGAEALRWLAKPAETGKVLSSDLPLPEPFTRPLHVPPVLRPRPEGATDVYELTQRVARQELLPGVPTEIWGYDGRYPGPTMISRSGRRTVVRHRNALPVPTVVHLHGGHTPARSDGYPTDYVRRGELRQYEYPLRQPAATLWYHDHRMDFTGPAMWRGLAGFHVVHDEHEQSLPLPAGERDVPLMLADRAFAADGALRYPALDPSAAHTPGVTQAFMGGVLGDVILVNGIAWPALEVEAARYRLRLLNASNARRYRLALRPRASGGRELVQIGSDGGLLEHPIAHDAIEIAPAERFEVVIDFSRFRVGERVTLVNELGHGPTTRVMQFHIVRAARDDSHIPGRLIAPLAIAPSALTRDFVFRSNDNGLWTINRKPFDPARISAGVALGTTETWRFTSDFHHPIHLHHTHFKVLSRNGRPPGPFDAGWKDVIDLRPAEQAAVIAHFSDYPGRYVLHCHNLEHEDMAMMANFQVQ